MSSIRTRITSAVVGCTALVVAVAALIVGTTAKTMLVHGLDDRLRARARWAVTVFRPPPGMQLPEGRDGRDGRNGTDSRDGRDSREPQLPPELQQTSPQSYVESREVGTGEEIQRSPSLPKDFSLADFGMKPGDPIRTIHFPDGRPFRLLAMESVLRTWSFPRDGARGNGRDGARDAGRDAAGHDPAHETPPGEPAPPRERHLATSWLAIDASDVEAEGRHLAWILAAVWAGATVLAWAVSVKLSAAVLRPVESVSRTIASLSEKSLASRVPMVEVPPELSTVVSRLNELLEKLERAFKRERASIANMAHELRNPISALRTTIEFGLYQELPAHGRKTLESSLALALRMQSLVNGLLTLTRIEAGQEVLARQEVDVVRLLRDAWTTVEARARERAIEATWRLPEALPLVTSPPHLELVAANLLDNAVSHGEAPGSVEIVIESVGPRARLRITNACKDDGDDPGERAGYFEPFWRSDPARSGARHFGLGLALCDRVVRLLGGTIEAHREGGRFSVTVELPAPPTTQREPAIAA